MPEKVVKSSKEMLAYESIKQRMYSRKLSPGQKIIYRDLEEVLGMSKTPIINALARLEQEGLVTSARNRGYYVKQLKRDEIVQLYKLRVRLEEIAIDYAIRNYHERELVELKNILDAYLSYNGDVYDSTRLKLDLDFHLQIARMGDNGFLLSILNQFYERVQVGLPAVFLTPLIQQFKREHSLIYEAIKAKDGQKAKKIIKQHEMVTLRLLDHVA